MKRVSNAAAFGLRPSAGEARLLLLLSLLLACGRTKLTPAVPHAVIDGRPIDFGSTPVLFPAQHDLLVSNAGRVTLHVTGIALQGEGFEGPGPTLDVAAGDTARLTLLFRPPRTGAFSGTLSLATDDALLPSLSIDLTGVGTEPGALQVAPLSLDFGRVGEGETATREITLASTGAADLFLGALGFTPGTPDAFGYVGSVKAPATLASGSRIVLGVRFSPTPQTQAASGALSIDSSDPGQPHVEVPLTASINRAPIAVATASVNGGPELTGVVDAAAGDSIALDGSGSSDPDGDVPLVYLWSLAAKPPGSNAALGTPAATQSSLRLDIPGVYSALLTVLDATGLPSFAPARVDIRAAASQDLTVELSWDQIAPDLDLHFLQQGAELDSAGDCFWANPDPAWGPHHGGDQLVGYGPERVTWQTPLSGTYGMQVVYFSANGATNPATTAQVRVFAQGVLVADVTHAFTHVGEVWKAGALTWPSGVVTP